jgi:hypothetical protein
MLFSVLAHEPVGEFAHVRRVPVGGADTDGAAVLTGEGCDLMPMARSAREPT